MPLEAVFFNAAVVSLSEAALGDFEAMYEKLDSAVLALSIVGLGSGIAVFAQNYLFSYKQESLCMILRKAAFARTVCMDMSFFDAPENQTGSILVSLQMHMNRVGQMLGIQLGISCAAIFTCVLSVSFSFFGCWELSAVLFGLMPLCGLLALTVAPARSTVATVLRIAGRFLRRKQAQTCQGLPRLLPRLPSFVWQHGTVPIEVAVGPHLSLGKEVGGILANGRQGSAVEALVVGPTLTLDFNPAHVVYHYESAGGGRYK